MKKERLRSTTAWKRAGLGSQFILAAVVCVVMIGCQGSSTPSLPTTAAATPTVDEQVLLALDCYNPMYQVNAEGRVTKLRLVWKHLPEPVMAEIGKLTELQALDLAFSTVTDEGLARLTSLQKVKSFGLSGTLVTDEGLVYLGKLRSLQWVWLSKQTVTEAGVEKLKEERADLDVYLQ